MTKLVRGWIEISEKQFIFIDGNIYIAQGSETLADVLKNSRKTVDNDTIAGRFKRDNNNLFVASFAVPELNIVRNSPLPVVEIVRRFVPKVIEVEQIARLG